MKVVGGFGVWIGFAGLKTKHDVAILLACLLDYSLRKKKVENVTKYALNSQQLQSSKRSKSSKAVSAA